MPNYGVYVIELNDLECSLYVGESFHSPEERLAQHMAGIRASSVVRKHGGRLRPDLYEHLPRVETRDEALELESECADALRAKGWSVHGGH